MLAFSGEEYPDGEWDYRGRRTTRHLRHEEDLTSARKNNGTGGLITLRACQKVCDSRCVDTRTRHVKTHLPGCLAYATDNK